MSEQNRPINILVTGVGAIIGYGVIKSIRRSGIPAYIVGMDIYKDAVGQHWCDEFIQAKYAVDPDYLHFVKEIIYTYKIDLVFFGTEQELCRVDAGRAELGKDINKFIINRSEILKLSQDKWATREYLLQHGLENYAIPSVIDGSYDEIAALFGKEFLLKPRSSYASKGINIVADAESFEFFKKRMGTGFMAQQLVGDAEHEYTVGVFGLGDGSYSASIALRRKLSQEGATAKAQVVEITELNNAVQALCNAFHPIGPTNLQFRMDGDKCYLLEINPRISSSTSIRAALGHNEAQMCIEYFLYGRIPVSKVHKGHALRFIDEVVVLE